MNTLNHAAAGAGISLAVSQPLLALPMAFVSHFVLDALPHHGHPNNGGYIEALKHKRLTYFSLGYESVGLVFLISLLFGQPWYVWMAGIIAVSPNLKWPYRYWFYERKGNLPPEADALTKFHQWVQWCERPWGIAVEICFSIFILFTVARLA